MTKMPRLWTCLVTEWVPLETTLAWPWWFALAHATWSPATQWREQFMAFARQDAWVSGEMVEAFFGEIATLEALVALVEGLMQERVLLRKEGRAIEECLFALADADGQFHHHRGRLSA